MKLNIPQIVYKLSFIGLLFVNNFLLKGQNGAKYWVQFTDKKNNAFNINKPEAFLSERALQRRLKAGAAISEDDLPVSKYYLDSINKTGITVKYSSKWFNSATIEVIDTIVVETLKNISFIKKIEKTADALSNKKSELYNKNKIEISSVANFDETYYGQGFTQINIENGTSLHELGFHGKGVQIAVLDGGFLSADTNNSLDSLRNDSRILGTKDFVDPGNSVYNYELYGDHGTAVLSVMAANIPGTFVGTAPEASYWLLRSEDTNSEYPVEEDNWVAAAEFADSVGADIITTSLGYNLFDDAVYNHTYVDMNGETLRISMAASMAASKGMLVVVSAGNDGNDDWHYIDAPADAKNILAVGAVTSNGTTTDFSSFGPSADSRIKPEVAAMGQDVFIQSAEGEYATSSGTSFSAPIISGLSACLIEAYPEANISDIIRAVITSADHFYMPNFSLGYGIPDFGKAYNFLQNKIDSSVNSITLFPNPFSDYLILSINLLLTENVRITCFNLTGSLIFDIVKPLQEYINLNEEIQNMKQGYYLIRCITGNKSWIFRAIKQTHS